MQLSWIYFNILLPPIPADKTLSIESWEQCIAEREQMSEEQEM